LKKILFVCTGNTCRSPMAEGLLRDLIPGHWRDDIEIGSAGTFAWDGQPATSLAVKVLRDKGIDISGHRARRLSPDLVHGSDLIVTMAEEHRIAVEAMAAGVDAEVVVLGDLDEKRDDRDIGDPIGGDESVYSKVRDDIYGLIGLLIEDVSNRFNLNR